MKDRPRRLAVLMAGLSQTLVLVGALRADERAPDPPQGAYRLRVGCAGIAAAAVARVDAESTRTDRELAEARTLLTHTRDEALAAGGRIGLTAGQIDAEIDRGSEAILERFSAAADEPAALVKERKDLGRVVVACALFEVIERRTPGRDETAPQDRRP